MEKAVEQFLSDNPEFEQVLRTSIEAMPTEGLEQLRDEGALLVDALYMVGVYSEAMIKAMPGLTPVDQGMYQLLVVAMASQKILEQV